jgi:hypothetical protein
MMMRNKLFLLLMRRVVARRTDGCREKTATFIRPSRFRPLSWERNRQVFHPAEAGKADSVRSPEFDGLYVVDRGES